MTITIEGNKKDSKQNTTSWAELVEFEDEASPISGLPPREEHFDEENQIKTIIEYTLNDHGKKVKTIKTYKVNRVLKTVSKRMQWAKFGDSKSDPPGPSPASCRVEEEMSINYNINDLGNDEDEDPLNKLKGKTVTCRVCKGDHWTTKCPYKDSLGPLQDALDSANKTDESSSGAGPSAPAQTTGKYVPPNMRDGGNKKGESMNSKTRDDSNTIRVTNLSESTRDSDLQELFKPFGSVSRIFLAKDKVTGQCKGYAFVSFYHKDDAAKAIQGVSGFGYDHLILKADWAKPNTK